MNYVLCDLNQMQYHVYLLQKKNQKISLSLTFILETIWYMGYTLLHWYKLVNKYNDINNVVEWLMHTFQMNSL